MGASDVRAGRAFVELGAKDTGLSATLKAAGKEVTKFGQEMFAAGEKIFLTGLSINAAIEGTALVFSKLGNDMAKASQRTGVNVEALSTLGFAASEAGVGMEELEGAIAKMNKNLLSAAMGSAQANESLQMLGLNLGNLTGKSPEARFKLFADALAKIRDPGQRAAEAMKIFGKSAAELLPLLSQGSKGITAFQERARALGLQMSTEDAEAAEIFHSRLHELELVLQHTAFVIGSAVAPAVQKMNEFITKVVVATNAWLSQHKDLVEMARKASMVIVGLGAAIAGAGLAVKAAGFALSGFGSLIGYVGSALSFVVSPLGLVIAGVVALGGYLLYTSGAGGRALQYLIDLFPKLKEDATEAIQGVSNALTSGQWDVAAKIAWNALQIEFQRGIAAVAAALGGAGSIGKAWGDMLDDINAVTGPWLARVGLSWNTIGSEIGGALQKAAKIALVSFSAIQVVVSNFGESIELASVTARLTFTRLWEEIKEGAKNAFNELTSYAMDWGRALPGKIAQGISEHPLATLGPAGIAADYYLNSEPDSGAPGGPASRAKTAQELNLETEQKSLAGDLSAKINAQTASNAAAIEKLDAAIQKIAGSAVNATMEAGSKSGEEIARLQRERDQLVAQAAKNQLAPPPAPPKLPGAHAGGDFDIDQHKHQVIGSFNPFRIAGAIGGSDVPKQQLKEAHNTFIEAKKAADTLKMINDLLQNASLTGAFT